jgi:hypothetical protein
MDRMFRVFGVTASRMVGKQVKSEEYMPKEEKVRGGRRAKEGR